MKLRSKILVQLALALSLASFVVPSQVQATTACQALFAPADSTRAQSDSLKVYNQLEHSILGKTVHDPTVGIIRRISDDGKVLAELDYIPRTHAGVVDEIDIGSLYVKEGYRRLGISKLLFATVLKEFPETETISTFALADDNLKAYQAAQARGLNSREAMKETPAYKVRNFLGFGEIIDKRCSFDSRSENGLVLTVKRGVDRPPPGWRDRARAWISD